VTPEDLEYENLQVVLKPYAAKGRTDSASFLNWFLENIYRLDDVAADDAICDSSNDKGIDGIYVDNLGEEIHVFQSKLRQNPKSTLGDTDLKAFAGSLTQIESADAISLLLESGANPELKKKIQTSNIVSLLSNNYTVVGVFVVNQDLDNNALEFLEYHSSIRVFDKTNISEQFIEIDQEGGISEEFSFDTDQIPPLVFSAKDSAKVYIFPAFASELVNLSGISDGSLFAQNVRLSLGNTKVNKDIAKSILDKSSHYEFPLFHNGITILCGDSSYSDDRISITNYVVVNGAQSLTELHRNKSEVTSDLKVLVKVIEIKGNESLAREITINSNNQNAIKPRDLRSNHQIQLRLKSEFDQIESGEYGFEGKRGEELKTNEVITNEEAGRLLLAFDLHEPWSCHQIYKVFDELYSQIFGRPEVNARRIILLYEILKLVESRLGEIENRPFGRYTLTKYFIMYLLSEIMIQDDKGSMIFQDPSLVFEEDGDKEKLLSILDQILAGLIIDLNYEAKTIAESEGVFDYKSNLKSPNQVKKLAIDILRTYEKDVQRGKAETIQGSW